MAADDEIDYLTDDEEEDVLPRWLEGDSLAPFVASEPETVQQVMELAAVGEDDVFYDLGCGDGRLCLEAAKRGARAIGIEIEEDLVATARASVEEAGLIDRCSIRQQDLLTVSLDDATVIVLYLLPDGLAELQDRILARVRECAAARVVCVFWGWKSLKAAKSMTTGKYNTVELRLYDQSSLVDEAGAGEDKEDEIAKKEEDVEA
eukprot:PLAT14719.1.p1 GENE.PLAT14719.1~~PLAT14719.1.p1  ORF type:complete len:205 (+),score=75.16 PLAT14719.1:186-800(+)